MEKIVSVQFGEKVYKLSYTEIDWDINIDDYVSIHYDNIIGELLVNSTLMALVGRMLADGSEHERIKEMEYKVYLAQREEYYRKNLYQDYKDKKRDKAPIREEIQNNATMDDGVMRRRKSHFRAIRDKDYMQVFYDALKSKDFKLNKLIDKIAPENHDNYFIEGKIHNVIIGKGKKPLIG